MVERSRSSARLRECRNAEQGCRCRLKTISPDMRLLHNRRAPIRGLRLQKPRPTKQLLGMAFNIKRHQATTSEPLGGNREGEEDQGRLHIHMYPISAFGYLNPCNVVICRLQMAAQWGLTILRSSLHVL